MNMQNFEILCNVGRQITMLAEFPADHTVGDKRPAMLFIHGGGWRGGSVDMFVPHMKYMAALGLACFAVDYRLQNASVGVADCLADCRAAVAYIRAHSDEYGIDTNRIYAMGDSAGGHLALCLGLPRITPDPNERVSLVVNCNGVVDMTTTFFNHLYDDRILADVSSESAWLARYEYAEALSPLYQVSADAADVLNVLNVQGLADPVVLPQETLRFHKSLMEKGVSSELWLLPDVTHAFILFDYQLDNAKVQSILQRICLWLSEKGFL
ncbi:hypothetical protein AGMMS49992_02070 [Clostridia bacterium]|nr:hypothetical protein AGMMS49992_02070 [Clostridia bacterium]